MAKPTRIHQLRPETPVDEAAPRLLSARLADVRQYEPALRKRLDEDAIHQMRVSARRLRAALELFDPDDAALTRMVKRLQDALGEVRDLQVQLRWFGDRRHGHLPVVIRRLHHALAHSERALAERLAIWQKEVARIEQELPDVRGKGRLGGRRVRRRLSRRIKQLSRRIDDAGRSLTARSTHRARITVKKVRYLAELVEPARPRAASSLLEELQALQGALGQLHDADVRMQTLKDRRLPERAHDLLLHAKADRERCADEAAQLISRWRKKKLARTLGKRL